MVTTIAGDNWHCRTSSSTGTGWGPSPSRTFEVALIPETLRVTGLANCAPGTAVNLEVDMMARYVVEYLRNHVAGGRSAPVVTREHLARHGFERKEGSR